MAYASTTDLVTVGLPAVALQTITPAQQAAALQNASDFADGFFRARYGTAALPFLTWDSSITQAVAKVAAYYLMLVRGMKPGGPDWDLFRAGYLDAEKFFNNVQRQQSHPNVTTQPGGPFPGATQPNFSSSSVVNLFNGQTAPTRGW